MIHNAAPSAAGSLARLGLADLALQVLGSRKVQTEEVVQEIVDEYIGVASIFFERRQFDHMERVLQYANQIRPTSKATNVLAKLAYQRDEIDAALELWQESLGLDAEQAEVHKHLGLVLMTLKHEYARAVSHLERAVQLDPTLVEEVKQWLVRGGIEVVEE